jgi:hypothetical protein
LQGIESRRDPFYWALNGNFNISVIGKFSCPFSFTITQQDKKFTDGLDKFSQPFNQFGLSPQYKWLTIHAGYRTMEFSEYSMSGSLFLGGGIEVKPKDGIISGSAGFGRMLKAIPVGGVDGVAVGLPAFERWGGAAKLKIGTEANFAELLYFRAEDNKNSIPFDTANNILPAENQIFGVTTKQKLTKNLDFEGSYHFSMYTKNTFEAPQSIERFTYINQIYNSRPSSTYNAAYVAKLDYALKTYKFGVF